MPARSWTSLPSSWTQSGPSARRQGSWSSSVVASTAGWWKVDGKDPIYVFNGFFMQMRTKFTQKGLSIYWFTVEWDSKDLSWADFRGKVLGPTDPAEAPADSLRGIVMKDWEKLGLKKKPDVGDNGVHASASPFEGLAERMNWLQ
eukprot:Sspe_Gene.28314::Locus_12752_Transcript_1_1_Confidence_1.000_Length_602::g.28314::m.28314